MLSDDASLHVHKQRRTVHRNDSRRKNRHRRGRKTVTRRSCKSPLREYPFLPKELTDRIISFADSLGIKIILIAKAGKLAYSSRPINEMSAYCCIYYVNSNGLNIGLVRYYKGKISIFDEEFSGHRNWLDSFALSYDYLAEEIMCSVLSGAIEPLVVPGLFLKSNNVKSS